MYNKLSLKAVLFLITAMIFIVLSACGAPKGKQPVPTAPVSNEQPNKTGYIDTHMHLDGFYRSRGKDVQDYETAANNLVNIMNQYNVAKALIMPPPQHLGQPRTYTYNDMLGAIQANPDRLYLVAGGGILNPMIVSIEPADVTDGMKTEFEKQAEAIVANGAVAFGETAALHLCMSEKHVYIVTSPTHPLYLLLADVAARHNIPIDIHMEAVPEDMPTPANLLDVCSANPPTLTANIPQFEQLLAHNREAKIVWQHVGWDNTGNLTVELVRRLVETHPNLYIALRVEARNFVVGGTDPMPNRIVNTNGQIEPEWLALMTDFPDRFMIGGDEFVGIDGLTPRRPQSFEETWPIIDQLPPELSQKVGYDNAAYVYNLN